MRNEIKKHHLNAKGKYYIDFDVCTCSGACQFYAPNNFAIDKIDITAYVANNLKRQKKKHNAKKRCFVVRLKRF